MTATPNAGAAPAPGAVWTMRDVLHAIRAGTLEPPPVAAALGLEVLSAENGAAAFGLALTGAHLNVDGSVHGGVIATLMDFALCSCVNDLPLTASVATANLTIAYHRRATLASEDLVASAALLHRSSRTATAQASVTDRSGVLHATALATLVTVTAPAQ